MSSKRAVARLKVLSVGIISALVGHWSGIILFTILFAHSCPFRMTLLHPGTSLLGALVGLVQYDRHFLQSAWLGWPLLTLMLAAAIFALLKFERASFRRLFYAATFSWFMFCAFHVSRFC
ncbi:MAG: hypothetical protein J0M12_05510 [Deltaproteobacteria bacterium]|nr:hypothetical protein [Deltaproteobacteria bacterium]